MLAPILRVTKTETKISLNSKMTLTDLFFLIIHCACFNELSKRVLPQSLYMSLIKNKKTYISWFLNSCIKVTDQIQPVSVVEKETCERKNNIQTKLQILYQPPWVDRNQFQPLY
jgi:hypothetical protein